MGPGDFRSEPGWLDKARLRFRKFYAKHYLDILDELFMLTVGLLFLILLIPFLCFLESLF